MEENQEANKQHVCKLCGMRFFSGKGLGGHMRGHKYAVINHRHREKIRQAESAAVYGLRENPKKSWKFSDSKRKKRIPRQEASCDVCGKDGFPSANALAIHMKSSHSETNDEEDICNCKECGKGFSSKRAMFGHMRCHSEGLRVSNETSGPVKKKRSKRAQVKVTEPPHFLHSASSGSGIEVDSEIENAAISLMMLNREFNSTFKVNLAPPRSDQITEDDVKSRDRMITSKKKKKKKRRKKSEFHPRVQITGELKLEVPVHENCEGVEIDTVTAADACLLELGTKFSNSRSEVEFTINECLIGGEIEKPGTESETACVFELGVDNWDCSCELELPVNEIIMSYEIEKPKIVPNTSYDPELGIIFCDYAPVSEIGKYCCKTCRKRFNSHQALGGHRAGGHKIKNASTPILDLNEIEKGDENSSEIVDNVSCRRHECSICLRNFQSGQALGGHKRAHYVEANGHDNDGLFDLNWPLTLAFENEDLL